MLAKGLPWWALAVKPLKNRFFLPRRYTWAIILDIQLRHFPLTLQG